MSAPANNPNPTPAGPVDEHRTGLPGLRTWPKVYLLVAASFLLWVTLLLLLTHLFT